MEAVDVLGGSDARERARLVEAVRQRALHEDAVHGRIGVEAVDQRVELGLRRARRKLVVKRLHARLGGLLVLAPHVDLRGGIGAHEHRGEAGLRPTAGNQLAHALRHALADRPGDGRAVEDLCAHGGRA